MTALPRPCPCPTAPLARLSDGELLEAVIERDGLAWAELLRRYRPLLFRCIGQVAARFEAVLTSEDANEIFAELCLALLRDDSRKLRAYDPLRGAKLSSYLGLLAIHATYDFLRQTSRRPLLVGGEGAGLIPERPHDGPTALERLLEAERWSELDALLAGCTARDRRFVQLYLRDGLAPDEIAAEMKISIKTVYTKKHKLREKLIALVGPEGEGDEG